MYPDQCRIRNDPRYIGKTLGVAVLLRGTFLLLPRTSLPTAMLQQLSVRAPKVAKIFWHVLHFRWWNVLQSALD